MTSPAAPALVINDGTFGGLLAAWTVGSVRTSDTDPAANRSHSWFPRDLGTTAARRRSLVERQTAICGLAGCTDIETLRLSELSGQTDPVASAKLLEGARITTLLLSAAIEAARLGLSRVIWPIHAGPEDRKTGTDINLERLADICDRAHLVSQLTTIDLPNPAGGAVKIEVPYADFTDAELMELALDLDAPLAACWWCAEESVENPCGVCTECTRWRDALTAVDPQGLLDPTTLSARLRPYE